MRFHRSALLAFEHYMASITAVSIVSVSTICLYGLLVAWLYQVENGPALPASEAHSSALVNAAWKDLAQISTRPHSFNSRQHELTRQYLLDRIQRVSAKSANSEQIDVISDESGFVITYDSNVGYWEGENVYVVIHGTSGTPGVLVSAHYDSVATAYGTTDDGIGVVTLLQLLEYFSEHRPFHNVVLNFNTGEEINLYGAHQFIKHPVSKYVSSFINLEGAGAGGRTALFRSSSYEALKAYSGSGLAFGSVIMQDIFKTGVVHSETDFEPYSEAGLHGLDMAFYKPRSRYHTALDNLKSTDKSSVKYMIDSAFRLTNFLAGERYVPAEDNTDELGVFFDIYGHKPLAFSMTGFARFSLFFAVLGPALIGYIVYYVMFKHPVVRVTAYGWVRMPVTFFFLVVVNITVVKMFTGHNPAIIYSSDLPIIAIGYFSLITSFITLFIAQAAHPTASQLPSILELLMFHWLLSVLSTYLHFTLELGGGYMFTFQYLGTLSATVVSFFPYIVRAYRLAKSLAERKDTAHGTDWSPNEDLLPGNTLPNEDAEDEGDALLVTPDNDSRSYEPLVLDDGYQALLEFLEFFFLAFLPSGFFISMAFSFVNMSRYGIAEGSPIVMPYALFSFLTIVSVTSLTPFISRFARLRGLLSVPICSLAFIVGLVLLAACLRSFPFNEISPLKVFVEQEIDYTVENSGHWSDGGRVNVVGLSQYVPRIISHIPSVKPSDIKCSPIGREGTLSQCSYTGLSPSPYINPLDPSQWLTISATIDHTSVAESAFFLTLSLVNSRGGALRIPDRVYELLSSPFSPPAEISIELLSTPGIPGGFVSSAGDLPVITTNASEVEFWTRCNFESGECDGTVPFHLRLSSTTEKPLTEDIVGMISVAAYFDEWAPEGMTIGEELGLDANRTLVGRIPAIDEFYRYMPGWATFQKRANGLVRVVKSVEYVDDED